MTKDCTDRRSPCPLACGLDIFGDRWSLLVIRDMLFGGKRRFSELAASEERIASNILADRLKRLEAHGLIHRERDPDNRRQVIYRLSDKGRDLAPALLEIIRWAARHEPNTGASKEFIERLERDPDGVLAELLADSRG